MALTNKLSAIGNAIREKTGGTDLLTLDQMATEIANIQGGGTVEELTITSNGTYNPPAGIDGYAPIVVNVPQDGAPSANDLQISGNCSYRFANNGWNWILNTYGNQITTYNISNLNRCFYGSYMLTTIPISVFKGSIYNDSIDLSEMFRSCQSLTTFPKITVPNMSYHPKMSYMFADCQALRTLPFDYFTSIGDWSAGSSESTNDSKDHLFYDCYSLREHPDMTCLKQVSKTLYDYIFFACFSLNEIVNYPVSLGTLTNNVFNQFVEGCYRIKNLTFTKNEDETPIVAKWKYQVIDLSDSIGYAKYIENITGYNSGITTDKRVSDDATYQALKDDPDWYSGDINYSRYNHNSAVNTINSLPDTSAYLATAGGTNTIKFKGASGASTDGGAINTLTEEEIAVATAKGWTVSLI